MIQVTQNERPTRHETGYWGLIYAFQNMDWNAFDDETIVQFFIRFEQLTNRVKNPPLTPDQIDATQTRKDLLDKGPYRYRWDTKGYPTLLALWDQLAGIPNDFKRTQWEYK